MHKSVLLDESIAYLNLKESSVVVDATLGYGGHSSVILKEISRGFLFAFDQDKNAIEFSDQRLQQVASNYEIIKSNFVNMTEKLKARNIEQVDGILFDLGVSSPQLDEADRGFSFHKDAPLDMRMDTSVSFCAYDVVNTYTKQELIRIFKEYGEEKFASSIATGIVNARIKQPIKTTLELTEIIKDHVPFKYRKEHHPARKVFQAIRIEVNHELEVCESAVKQALDLIGVGGRVCVITFHSLEDRIVKKIFKEKSQIDANLKNLPVIPEEYMPSYKIIANISPTEEEIKENNRARSARLRVIERIK